MESAFEDHAVRRSGSGSLVKEDESVPSPKVTRAHQCLPPVRSARRWFSSWARRGFAGIGFRTMILPLSVLYGAKVSSIRNDIYEPNAASSSPSPTSPTPQPPSAPKYPSPLNLANPINLLIPDPRPRLTVSM